MQADHKPRVLVVEDSPNWREMFGFLLASEGYDVDVAVSLIEGLRLLDENQYQLVVVDLQLSTPDEVDSAGLGMILLDRLANSRPKVPAIAVTGWDRVSPGTPRKLFKSYDIFDFFWKSDFDANEFRRAVAECLKTIQPGTWEVKIEGDKNEKWIFLAHPYEQASFDLFETGLSDLFSSYGYKRLHTSDAPPGKRLWHQIALNIKRSDLGLYDITQPNSSIYMALGFAVGTWKPCLILRGPNYDKTSALPVLISDNWIRAYRFRDELHNITQENLRPDKMSNLIILPEDLRSTPRRSATLPTALIAVADKSSDQDLVERMLARMIPSYQFEPMTFHVRDEADIESVAKRIRDADLVLGSLASANQIDFEQKNADLALILGLSLGLGTSTVIMQRAPVDIQSDFASILRTYEKPEDIEKSLWEWMLESQFLALTMRENLSYDANAQIEKLINQVSSLRQALKDFKEGQSVKKIRTDLSNSAFSMRWGEMIRNNIAEHRGTIIGLVTEIAMNLLLAQVGR